MLERTGLAALRLLDPERAHALALTALRAGLGPQDGPVWSPRLQTRVFGLDFPNPIGVAAGFDKNARAVDQTLRSGFGFMEVGAVTPRPQVGNARPRLFRLAEDRAAINRFGFNNEGMEVVATRLAQAARSGIVGINVGANKDAEDRVADYIAVMERFQGLVNFFTINISSPNTERLRDLQGRAALDHLLERCLAARDTLESPAPVLLKIAPDLTEQEVADIAEVCLARSVDGIIATNTTVVREGLRSANAAEAGGLSGQPLFERSTEILRLLARHTDGAIPLIGAGGVGSAAQAYTKIRAGASLVQLYTAMVYEGVSLGGRIAEGVEQLLQADGFANIADAVGADRR